MHQDRTESAAQRRRRITGRSRKRAGRLGLPADRSPASRSAAPAAASPTTAKSSRRSSHRGLDASPVHEVLIEESRDRLEGIRTGGDARPQRQRRHHLLDRKFRPDGRSHRRLHHRRAGPDADRQGIPGMRDAAMRVIRAIGVETGGSNIQFAIDPENGEMVVIEMNPRVSRSSALASKAPVFPSQRSPRSWRSATRSTKLTNDITRVTNASVRANDRLRRREDPAVRLRKNSPVPIHAHHPNEIGG